MTLEEHINKFKEAFIFCSNEEAEINIAMKGYQIEDLIHYLEELSELQKAFDKTEHCCPYDQEKCSKTNCFINGGDCSRRTKKQEQQKEREE